MLNKRAVQRASVTALAQQNAGAGPAAALEGAGELSRALSAFAGPAESLASALRTFGDTAERLGRSLAEMPTEVHLKMDPLTVTLNAFGLDGLADLDEKVQGVLGDKIAAAVGAAFDRRLAR